MNRQLRFMLLGVLSAGIGSGIVGATRLLPRPEGSPPPVAAAAPARAEVTDGALRTAGGVLCPLSHTDVQAEISGLVARVTVTQRFVNPTGDRVEAIYTFPLPQHAAIDDMTLHVGGQVIRGLIMRREEAVDLYRRAREAGHTAALLEQERPNVFTQSVANIPPHGPVTIEISYVEVLDYDAGRYAFVYPMVVGPRYVPGTASGASGSGWSAGTTRVPDASRITPPVAGMHVGRNGSRAGHDISLSVRLDAGVPLEAIGSPTHEVDVDRPNPHAAVVRLRNAQEIPNRDFVLSYDPSGAGIEDAVLAHAPSPGGGGYFGLILQPPDRPPDEDVARRELVFVLDTSGSMRGYPIETAKAVIRRAIGSLRFGDTFNLVTFAGDTRVLFAEPVEATSRNVERAHAFLEGEAGSGGTEMMKAIRIALGDSIGPCPTGECRGAGRKAAHDAIRIVCFMTDGYVGDDMAIVGEVSKHPETRVFSFGIGSSVNRFLLDGMARAGRGEVEYVLNAEAAAAAADRFYERINTPVLTDITIDWGSLPVEQITPAQTPDLFAARAVVVLGRYRQVASGVITLRGLRAGRPFAREVRVALPAHEPASRAVSQLWARARIGELSAEDWTGLQTGTLRQELRDGITRLGLEFRLMTPFTAFVAVEERTIVEGGRRRTVHVPVEMPHHVSPEGVFGDEARAQAKTLRAGGNVPMGIVGGTVGGLLNATSPRPAPSRAPGTGTAQEAEAVTVAEPEASRDARGNQALPAKLHVSLAALVACVEKATTPSQATACGVDRHGRVDVTVRLTERANANVLGRLQRAGLVLDRAAAGATPTSVVTGRITIAGLTALARVPEVTLIAVASR